MPFGPFVQKPGPARAPTRPGLVAVRWHLLLPLFGLCLSLGHSAATAGEQEDNYAFMREDAIRRGVVGRGPGGSAHDNWDWNAPKTAETTESKPRLRIHVRPRKQVAKADGGPHGGGETMCVRTCDGFAFPISARKADPAIAEFLCKTSCPGAPTQVFTRHPGAEMSTAISLDKNQTPYAKLAAAGLFQKQTVAACTCRPQSAAVAVGPIYNDPTLRKGDMIVLEDQKVVVFNGSTSLPFDEDDFVDLKRSRLVSQSIRRLVDDRFTVKQMVAANGRAAKKRGDKTKSLVAQAKVAPSGVPAIQAFAAEPRRPRVILPALFETLNTSPPLDLAATAQTAPPVDKTPAPN